MGYYEVFLLNIILFFLISLLFKIDKIEKKLQELTDLDNKEKQVNNE
mgnify:FL=1|jgi:hypothetical protein